MVEELSLSSCVELNNDRRRIEIELKEGETTIASWSQFLHEFGFPVDSPYSPQLPDWLSRATIQAKIERNSWSWCYSPWPPAAKKITDGSLSSLKCLVRLLVTMVDYECPNTRSMKNFKIFNYLLFSNAAGETRSLISLDEDS